MISLDDELLSQRARCQLLLDRARKHGAHTKLLTDMLRKSLARAERAAADGDLPAMIRALNDLQAYSE